MTIPPFASDDIDFALRVFRRLDGRATSDLQHLTPNDCWIDSQELENDTLVLGDFHIRRFVGSTASILGPRECIQHAIGEPVYVPGSRDEPDDTDIVERVTVASWAEALGALIELVAADHYRNIIEGEALAEEV